MPDSTLADKWVGEKCYRVDAEGFHPRRYWLTDLDGKRTEYPTAAAALAAFEAITGEPFKNNAGPDLSPEAGFTYAGGSR